ncbi:MAG: baseplate J/gp47 family protein [Clostridia bacterium]|nr:baseplate J/gp47 family protein [Clostridia bacterium]
MAYFAPYIDETGVHIPTYQDRLDALTSAYVSIFGPEANLEISSPDYQLLSVFARALDDLSALITADFASRNPAYAAGAALDLLLPLFGLTRQGATYSTVMLTLSGTPGAVLPAVPEALDDAGYLWRGQTAGITLDENGERTVEAVCATPGVVSAAVGAVHRLVSPVAGLAAVVNRYAAIPGRDAESDASCRARMRLAAAAPAVSTLEALESALRAIPGVRSCVVYENDTDATDARGIQAHSLCAVMDGGLTSAIAPVLFAKKAPGIGTYGSISATVEDSWGHSHTVSFQRAAEVPVTITVVLKPLAGFDASAADQIREALLAYGETLGVGQDLVVPALYGLIYAQDTGSTPTFSVSTLHVTAGGTATSGVLHGVWNQRYGFQSTLIRITVEE